jgi:hypothetical protein
MPKSILRHLRPLADEETNREKAEAQLQAKVKPVSTWVAVSEDHNI